MHLKRDLIAALTFRYAHSIGADLVTLGDNACLDIFAIPIIHADIGIVRIDPDHRLT